MPYSRKAEENAPSRKYFMAASWAARRRVSPASTYRLSDRISRAMNTTSRSEAAASRTMPSRANSSSGYTSGGLSSGSPRPPARPVGGPPPPPPRGATRGAPGPPRDVALGDHQGGQDAGGQQRRPGVAGDAVQRHRALEGDPLQVPVPGGEGAGDDQAGQGQAGQQAPPGPRPEGHHQQQHDPGHEQGQLGGDGTPVDLRHGQGLGVGLGQRVHDGSSGVRDSRPGSARRHAGPRARPGPAPAGGTGRGR